MLLLCTRKASDEAVSDAEGLRDAGAVYMAMSVLYAGARLRAMRARIPEKRGAGRRWMKVDGSAGMRTEMWESMVEHNIFTPAEEVGFR